MRAARRAACAVAALVAQLSTKDLSAGLKYVEVSERCGHGKSISPLAFLTTLPPSKTTSGLIGQASAKATPVVLQGDSSPGQATGCQLAHFGSLITAFSVNAPTVSA